MFCREFNDLRRDRDTLFLLKQHYREAKPFPHMVLKNVFDPLVLNALEREVPRPDESWWRYDNELERKYAKDDLMDVSAVIQRAVWLMQSKPFTDFLEKVTGIEGLIADATLRGGGLHQIARGGKLDIHADYNVHPIFKIDRRINVILYLNSGWGESYGGNLELWDRDMKNCVVSVPPKLGTLVFFNTTDWAYHGHPDPLTCPEGGTRKSIALYYYTNGRPDEERSAPHSTLYKRRPQDPEDPQTEALRQQRAKGRV